MLIFLLLLLLVLGGVALMVWGIVKDNEDKQIGGTVMTIILGATLLITSIVIPLTNLGRLQEMRAFQESNSLSYEMTATKTQSILSEQEFIESALIPIEGSIEKISLATVISGRLVEWRDEVVRYNNDLMKYRAFHDHWCLGFYYPDPIGLKQLVIK